VLPTRLDSKAPRRRRWGAQRVGLLLAALVWAGVFLPLQANGPATKSGQRVRLTMLATTDVHGNIWPYDYLRARPAERGLAKVASYVKQVRARQPNTLVLDCGDSFEGTPIAYLYAEKHTEEPNPVVATMNAIGYDAMAVGNHEFNFGLWTLWRLKEQAAFPILGANIVSSYHDPVRTFEPYIIRTVGGVRVAILGLVTPGVPYWDPPEHRTGYEFRDLVETAKHYVPELRRKADLVILLVHSGLGRDPDTGEPEPGDAPGEDRVWDIADQVPGIDAIFFGHTHRELAGKEVNGTLLVQARNWAHSVAQVDFALERDTAEGPWHVTKRGSELVPMDATIPADPEILALTRSAHEETERYLSTVVAQLDQPLDGRTGRIEDNPLVELIQRAQLEYGQADVSLAALFSTWTRWPAGPVTIRDVYSLYFYENGLFTVEITGAQLKEALEYSARSFKTFPWSAGESPFDGLGYNYDMAEGVSYRIDLSRPPGDRIVDLRFQGAPLAPDHKLRLALNSYRWSGGGGYDMLRHAKVVHRAGEEVRDLIIDYLRKHKTVDTGVDHNWEIIPAPARDALREWVLNPPPRAVLTPPRRLHLGASLR
jgi:2',3'-cyclic-nucleotide 2'-phosphodiesterase (5'-nucleotidase family)